MGDAGLSTSILLCQAQICIIIDQTGFSPHAAAILVHDGGQNRQQRIGISMALTDRTLAKIGVEMRVGSAVLPSIARFCSRSQPSPPLCWYRRGHFDMLCNYFACLWAEEA